MRKLKPPQNLVIGPSPCDKNRIKRETELRTLDKLLPPTLVANTHIVLGDEYDLLREVMSCYQNGAYLATAVMCRSAMEFTLYVAISRDLKVVKVPIVGFEGVAIDYKHRTARRGDILQLARKRGYLDRTTERRFKWVLNIGDFGAHFGQKLDKAIFGTDNQGREPRHITWVTRQEALKALRQTALTLKHFMDMVKSVNFASRRKLTLEDIIPYASQFDTGIAVSDSGRHEMRESNIRRKVLRPCSFLFVHHINES